MKLDFATLSFGYRYVSGGGTPNWSTSLGQGKEHKINDDPKIDEILKGIIYCSVNLANISAKIGKGGQVRHGNESESGIVLGSVFSKVYVNDVLIRDAKFVLILTKDLSGAHTGRFKIKYGPSNKYEDVAKVYSNEFFFAKVTEQLGLSADACWFVDEINVKNQDELVLKTFIVNSNGTETYADTVEHHEAWGKFTPDSNIPLEEEGETSVENMLNPTKHTSPSQKIFYGVPGCGKSYTIKEELKVKDINQKHTKRVVFHPDYTNADFVGQILPILEKDSDGKDTVSYKFAPGPFSQILRSAYSDKNNDYALIIEEINRGNAAAIFGELFQLLDRLDDNETDVADGFSYNKGWSSYCVDNDFINAYMRGIYDKTTANDNDENIKLWDDNIVFTENTGIRLPPNLSIFATMNTSDQNVFTLDNAFQRRWEMQYIKNELDELEDEQKKQAEAKIGDTDVTWKDFYSKVNELLVNDMSEQDLSSMEDKQLGVWFVKNKDKKISLDLFANKVLKYLWDDAFKFNKEIIFNTNEYKSLSQILETATNEDEGISNIFVGDVKNLFMSKINSGIDNANETEER